MLPYINRPHRFELGEIYVSNLAVCSCEWIVTCHCHFETLATVLMFTRVP